MQNRWTEWELPTGSSVAMSGQSLSVATGFVQHSPAWPPTYVQHSPA